MQKSMSSDDGRRDIEIQGKGLDSASRHNLDSAQNVKGKETLVHVEDQEIRELYSRAKAQEKEIMYLREQTALASTRQLQMLNEKYALERKLSELRMALDEKQSEVITSASNELARRKGDLEVNLNLLNELKAVEDDRQIFTSATIGILAEYGALPHVTNASSLSYSLKHLHDRLQLRIRTSHARLAEMTSMIGNNARNEVDKDIPSSRTMNQLPSSSTGVRGYSHNSHYMDRNNLEPADGVSTYSQGGDFKQVKSLTRSTETHQLRNNENLRNMPDIHRNVAGHIAGNMLNNENAYMPGSEQRTTEQFSHPHTMHGGVGSFGSEDDGPGIEGFQIIGDAKPGCKLLGCGYPVRGTSLCMFLWVRHYPDGTRQYIEGATNPDYVLTADDVDKLIAVECIPMDEQGRQGDIVRIFANDNDKITCDEDMQDEIDAYVSKGQATFNVQILLDSSENWEQATLIMRRSGFQVKVEKQQDPVISEKYSNALLIKIPSGLSSQFVLTCSNGSSFPFSTSNDIRSRDTVVLTMRIFQSRALDEKRKGKA